MTRPSPRHRPRSRPFTGAWIETTLEIWRTQHMQRRPFTGAWIETGAPGVDDAGLGVAPSRGRGSKPLAGKGLSSLASSPLHGGVDRNRLCEGCDQRSGIVAPSRGRGSKLGIRRDECDQQLSPLHGGVDRNGIGNRCQRLKIQSPLHGGVDRNPFGSMLCTDPRNVAPSRGRGSKPIMPTPARPPGLASHRQEIRPG